MYVMYDSTEVATIPGSAPAVAGYVGGAWPTFHQLEGRWPHAHRLSIAVTSAEDAECLDIERGDATPQDAPVWFHRQVARGVHRPVFYASASVVLAVEEVLRAAGIERNQYRVWSAHYTGVAHVCGAACGLGHPADATQWTDRALGRNLDESLCADSFFAKPDPLAVLTPEERITVKLYDHLVKHPHLHPHQLAAERATLVRFRKETWLAAVKGATPNQEQCEAGWNVHHRRERYQLLLSRTR